jgi:hypothetical protein
MRGILNHTNEFICPGAFCELPLERDSVITFRAYSSDGTVSSPVNATIRVALTDAGYTLKIDTLEPTRLFIDSCSQVWGFEGASSGEWSVFPQSPRLLNTDKNLHYLASELVSAGLVDVSNCPGGGYGPEGLNGCAIEKAMPVVLEWQNQYDFNVWLAGRDHGIPPKILKTLIEVESQFWPGNSRFFMEEFGLAQINQLGTDALLRWDKDFYDRVCPNVLGDCSERYLRQPTDLRAMLRGYVLRTMDAECPTCRYGMDMVKAQKSIHTIARALRSTCVDTNLILDTYDFQASYEELWKYTLATYHSGFQCMQDGIETSLVVNAEQNWSSVANVIPCSGTRDYVENFWAALGGFEAGRLTPGESKAGLVAPVFLATRTPVPSPTPNVSHAKIKVQAFIDLDGDGLPSGDEWLDGILVQLHLASGALLEGRTDDGEVNFDLTGYPIGMRLTTDLPGLYRSVTFDLPQQGTVPVVFIFTRPELPAGLP